jgi:hypothetical protein
MSPFFLITKVLSGCLFSKVANFYTHIMANSAAQKRGKT